MIVQKYACSHVIHEKDVGAGFEGCFRVIEGKNNTSKVRVVIEGANEEERIEGAKNEDNFDNLAFDQARRGGKRVQWDVENDIVQVVDSQQDEDDEEGESEQESQSITSILPSSEYCKDLFKKGIKSMAPIEIEVYVLKQ